MLYSFVFIIVFNCSGQSMEYPDWSCFIRLSKMELIWY